MADFNWEDNKVPDNFFDDSPEDLATDAASVIEEINTEENLEDKGGKAPTSKEKTDEELADELFNDFDEDVTELTEEIEEEDEDGKDKKADKKAGKASSKATLEFLQEKGFVDFELEEGEELTDELAEEITEDAWEQAIDNKLTDLFDGLPDVVKHIVKYAKDGGDIETFLGTVAKKGSSPMKSDMDMSDEANQELVMRTTLKEEGNDDEYIDMQLEFLKDSGKLEAMSDKKFKAWKANQKNEEAELTQKQAETARLQKEKARQDKLKLTTNINSLDEVSGFKLSKQDKRDLPSYFLDKTVKLESGATMTNYHSDVYEVMSNEIASVQLAKLLKNRNKDGSFNFSKIEKEATTKVTREVKDNIRRNKTNTPSRSVGSGGSQKTLADFF